jgi:hypothetical protein
MERVVISDFIASSFESITVSTVSIGVTAALLTEDAGNGKVLRASKVFLSVETNPVRLRWDGGDPTAALGHLLTAGTSIEIEGEKNVRQLRMIRQGGADGTVMVTVHYDPVIRVS